MPPKYISSRANPVFKALCKLASSSKNRRIEKKSIIEGIHLIQEWLMIAPNSINAIYLSENAFKHPEIKSILEQISVTAIFSSSLFNEFSSVENSVGIIAIIDTPSSNSSSQFDINADAVWIDELQDTGNIGTILRTSAAAGIYQIITSNRIDTLWSPKCLRAAMGAHLNLTFFEADSITDKLKECSRILATSSHAKNCLYETNLLLPAIWIAGNEGTGVTKKAQEFATQHIKIPMTAHAESLNVSVATAICLFEQVRQRKKYK